MTKPYLQELLICRSILHNNNLKLFAAALSHPEENSLQYRFISRLIAQAEQLGLAGNLLRGYVIHRLSHDENIVAQVTELTNGKIGRSLYDAFLHDMKILLPLFLEAPSEFLATKLLDDYQPTTAASRKNSQWLRSLLQDAVTPKEFADGFLAYYRRFGYGDIASYCAFRWDHKAQMIAGIHHFEAMQLDDIIGYDRQKKQLIDNTLAFLNNKPANNALLIGARGTGKSSSVKALAHAYYSRGLRLLQLTKSQLQELPAIMEYLRRFASKHFIIFLDDLSFEEFETEYKYLKSAIEGGVESRPANVLIYATSNRRHLIKETWKDRSDELDELYRNDSMNETISLSDRFGLVITFLAPDQGQYLSIIDHGLQKENIHLDAEQLRILGHRWELEHSGRSGRTAQQFVNYYLGHER
jgi:predicted AAA+ superfamily ATPase